MTEVAKRMGFADQFTYTTSADIFKEYAALSGYKNETDVQPRDFDISALATVSEHDYNAMTPIQWPVTTGSPQGTARFFADGKFYTANGKAKFIAVENSEPKNPLTKDYPLRLNTGRIRDQWHTMTRTGKTARLSGHIYEPFIEIHPLDAQAASIQHNELAKIKSQWGEVVCRAIVTTTQQQGSVFIPIHWNEQFASTALVDSLVDAVVDPISGQPEYKSTPVHISAYKAHWYGFLLTQRKLEITTASYWSCSRGDGVWRYEIAGDQIPENWADCARSLLCKDAEQVEWTEYHDAAKNRYRAARIENGHLESCIFIGPEFTLPERDWLIKLFKDDELNKTDRASILTGKAASGQKDAGRVVCACFNVGTNTLVDAIKSQKLISAEQVGVALRAGTNCGSCVPEIHKLIATTLK
jgi:assimilatory nitrate reductase catalytic subunit